jgi:hypothetical protein
LKIKVINSDGRIDARIMRSHNYIKKTIMAHIQKNEMRLRNAQAYLLCALKIFCDNIV